MFAHYYYYYLNFFDQVKTHGGSKITKENYETFLEVNLLWPVVINKNHHAAKPN